VSISIVKECVSTKMSFLSIFNSH